MDTVLALRAMRSSPSALLSSVIVTLLSSALMIAGEGTVSAQSIRAAALPPVFRTGGGTSELRDKFHEAIIRGLASLSGPSGPNGELGEVLAGAETRARLGDELIACGAQAACLPRALTTLRVNRLLATEISVVGKSFTISVRLFDNQGRELTHADELCEICTVREADEALTKAAARLSAAARQFPVDAMVVAAERARPTPPPPREEPRPAAVTPQPAASGPDVADPPPPAMRREHRKFPYRPVAFASVGVGIIGLAVGIPLLVIDGRPTCDAPNPATQCKEVYNTIGGGGAMVAIGALGLLASIPLFYLDYRDRHRAPGTAMLLRGGPTAGGAGLTFEGRF